MSLPVNQPASPIEPRYLTMREAGKYLGGRSPEAMRMLARRGRIRVIKLGRSLLMDTQDIDAAMSAMKVEIE